MRHVAAGLTRTHVDDGLAAKVQVAGMVLSKDKAQAGEGRKAGGTPCFVVSFSDVAEACVLINRKGKQAICGGQAAAQFVKAMGYQEHSMFNCRGFRYCNGPITILLACNLMHNAAHAAHDASHHGYMVEVQDLSADDEASAQAGLKELALRLEALLLQQDETCKFTAVEVDTKEYQQGGGLSPLCARGIHYVQLLSQVTRRER